jgi:prepilin-type N-terminal cleavage/methylation domain-containing protein
MSGARSITAPRIISAARQGFTLIEVVASMLLFAVGGMAVIGVVVYGLSSAMRAQADATALATALSVLKDPLPLGAEARADGTLAPWRWSRAGATATATDAAGETAWAATSWPLAQDSDVLVPDMADPRVGNPALFPSGGAPAPGCARGWLNGYYVERREQSRAADRIAANTRVVEVRVDVYWSDFATSADARHLAALVDRVVRQGGL